MEISQQHEIVPQHNGSMHPLSLHLRKFPKAFERETKHAFSVFWLSMTQAHTLIFPSHVGQRRDAVPLCLSGPSVWHCGHFLGSLSLCEGCHIPPWFPPESVVCFLFVFLLNYHRMTSTSPNVLSYIIQLKRCFTSTSALRCGSFT